MTELVEVRSTINMPGLPVDRIARVDPTSPYMVMLLEAGHLVLTGRTFSIPTQNAGRGVRPASVEEAAKAAKPKKKARKRAAPRKTEPS